LVGEAFGGFHLMPFDEVVFEMAAGIFWHNKAVAVGPLPFSKGSHS